MQFVGNGDIVGMVSREGEVVPLKTRIKPSLADGAVEKWLVQVRTGWRWLSIFMRKALPIPPSLPQR